MNIMVRFGKNMFQFEISFSSRIDYIRKNVPHISKVPLFGNKNNQDLVTKWDLSPDF